MGRELDHYLDTLFKDQTGFVYVATKQTDGTFSQLFYQYPTERASLASSILGSINLGETYVCPSVFATPSGAKDQCLGSSVAWVDFDGNFPETWPNTIPKPNMVVQTSGSKNVHAYWKFPTLLPAVEVEEINRRLSYCFAADLSGWDANQLLRPPETRNHKRGTKVVLTTGPAGITNLSDFVGLASPPALPKNFETVVIPPIEEALATITWPANLKELFENGLPEPNRSAGMFALAAGLAELNVRPQYILAVLLHADNTAFHKFHTRPDQKIRLMELVTRAVLKVKQKQVKQQTEEPAWKPLKLSTLLTTEYKMEWLLFPYIHKTTCGILSGPPGVGKSLMCLSLAQCLCLGTEFLGLTPTKPLRIGFISLEMDGFELNSALIPQVNSYSSSDMASLDEKLLVLPFGEPKFFNDKNTERLLVQFVGDNHLDGIFVDSLSSTTPGDLSSEKETKFIFELDAKLRSRFQCFTFYIHHNRKAQADNKKPNKLADLHGSVHIQSKPTSVITLWPLDPKGNRISFKPLKTRSAAMPDEFVVSRDDRLHYFINNSVGSQTFGGVTIVSAETPEEVVADDIGSNDPDSSGDGGNISGSAGFNNKF